VRVLGVVAGCRGASVVSVEVCKQNQGRGLRRERMQVLVDSCAIEVAGRFSSAIVGVGGLGSFGGRVTLDEQ
jgi:L-amino acid N-acyltransferase YncA